jgi:truncated hemoglobin YjbI
MPTLLEKIGGSEVVNRVADRFCDLMRDDERLKDHCSSSDEEMEDSRR